LLENTEINGVSGSEFTPEEAVKELNSFVGNFSPGGTSSENNGKLDKGPNDDFARVVMNGELVDPGNIVVGVVLSNSYDMPLTTLPTNSKEFLVFFDYEDGLYKLTVGNRYTCIVNIDGVDFEFTAKYNFLHGQLGISLYYNNSDRYIGGIGVGYPNNTINYINLYEYIPPGFTWAKDAMLLSEVVGYDDIKSVILKEVKIVGADSQTFVQKKSWDAPEMVDDMTLLGLEKGEFRSKLLSKINEEKINIGDAPSRMSIAYTTGAIEWYRIAQSNTSIGNNSGLFKISHHVTGQRGSIWFIAQSEYGATPSINILSASSQNNDFPISQIRIVYHPTNAGNFSYLEVRTRTANVALTVVRIEQTGWNLLSSVTIGGIPSDPTGYLFISKPINTGLHTTGKISSLNFNFARYNVTASTAGRWIRIAKTTEDANVKSASGIITLTNEYNNSETSGITFAFNFRYRKAGYISQLGGGSNNLFSKVRLVYSTGTDEAGYIEVFYNITGANVINVSLSNGINVELYQSIVEGNLPSTHAETIIDVFINGLIGSVLKSTTTSAATSTTTGSLISSGGLGVSGAGYFGGTVTANGSVLTSDERLKKDVRKIDDDIIERASLIDLKAFKKMTQMPAEDTEIEDIEFTDEIGVIAQEVDKILPEIVHKNSEYWGVDYIKLLILQDMAFKKRLIALEQKMDLLTAKQ